MADPSTMMAGATGISAIGNLMQGRAQSNAASYNASQATYNAGIAEQNANIAIAQGNAESYRQGIDAQRQIGKMRALYGASGVSVEAGSPLDVLADSTRNAVIDQQITQYNYALKAQQYRQQANSFNATATLDNANASNSKTSGYLNAGGTLMSGMSKAWLMSAPTSGGNKIPLYE